MRALIFLLPLLALGCYNSHSEAPPPAMAPLTDLPLLPRPVEVTNDPSDYLWIDTNNGEPVPAGYAAGAVEYLKSNDLPAVQLDVLVDSTLTLRPGAYLLRIGNGGVTINAPDTEGALNATKTLAQVMRFSPNTERGRFLPAGTITDQPRYAYRGMMLDVSRHFFGVDSVKTVIDHIAAYKLNYLHLHLSDDQGWRIEIESWPELTRIGGKTEVDGTPGGFYTQAQYRELVDYAAARGVTIVPEIDLPGHTNAALSAYPELNADGVARAPYTGTRVGFSTLDASKEITFEFIDDVVRELAALTPGPFIHLGGDESDATEKADYLTFVTRAQEIVARHGKRMIGWNEITQAELLPGTVVHYWRFRESISEVAGSGNQVLMSPANRAYLDMKYDSLTPIGLNWAAYIPLDSAYAWDPAATAAGVGESDILGVEAPLWTETVRSVEDIEYLLFPRLPALAEVGWTPQRQRNLADFRRRLAVHAREWAAAGVNAYAYE